MAFRKQRRALRSRNGGGVGLIVGLVVAVGKLVGVDRGLVTLVGTAVGLGPDGGDAIDCAGGPVGATSVEDVSGDGDAAEMTADSEPGWKGPRPAMPMPATQTPSTSAAAAAPTM